MGRIVEVASMAEGIVDTYVLPHLTQQNIITAAVSVVALVVVTAIVSEDFRKKIMSSVMQSVKFVPGGAAIVAAEKKKTLDKMELHMKKAVLDGERNERIPLKGTKTTDLIPILENMKSKDCDWKHGRAFGYVYTPNLDHIDFMNKVYGMYSSTNPLHTSAFPSVQRMEAEVVRMTATMLNGDAEVLGTMTSGGSESLLMSMKTYRDWALETKGIKNPEIIAPITIHAAIDKGAHYFGIKLVHIPLRADFRVDVDKVRKAINKNTIAIYASAPAYPHGVVDPIEELGAIAQKNKIAMHVDACLGGFMLPWIEKLGYPLPCKWDFRVPGVTSMSADVHKYGYSAKGASVVLYRNEDLLMYQFFAYANWPGGLYGSPAALGSRPGGLIATAWAALIAQGEDGFLEIAKGVMETSLLIQKHINAIEGLQVVGRPDATILAFTNKPGTIDILKIADRMSSLGWHLERQQFPNSVHMTVTMWHKEAAEQFGKDLRESVQYVKDHPEEFEQTMAAIYGMSAKIPDRSIVTDIVKKYLAMMYKV